MNTRIGILGTAQGPHIQSLLKSFHHHSVQPILIPPTFLTSRVPGHTTAVSLSEQLAINDINALLVRSLPGGSLEQVIYRMDVLHRLEKSGVRVINRPGTLEKMVDKFYTLALLADAGIPVPPTVVTERFEQAMAAVSEMGTVVVKPLFGSLGTGITLVDDPEIAYRVFRALELGRYVYYLQQFLPHDNEDYRLFIIEGQVVAAMRRRGTSWKTNISCGATAEYVNPDPVLAQLALNTADVLNADYVGVDILISNDKPYVLEANGIPGWMGLQTVAKVNIADLLVQYVLETAAAGGAF
ncbi:ATP-grasp domain-containing protein [Sporomusa sphaeroides]|uniref:ATP-grasp domain-containing protein n=1 Tax=Sporomusa sphaeroides TaxID=47679 RepID=UPI00203015F8|nr:RimK family alpha-L-glutamate ligase [Sporomusa sphaeroides]MCM0759200.1 RimK family alpha-L-glutamate ligase [Sporomusa sphaeroides DSM 2875]HML35282.1 RimK family alpha-L-glutamate ligase [Sporomusa sphaeroides]